MEVSDDRTLRLDWQENPDLGRGLLSGDKSLAIFRTVSLSCWSRESVHVNTYNCWYPDIIVVMKFSVYFSLRHKTMESCLTFSPSGPGQH